MVSNIFHFFKPLSHINSCHLTPHSSTPPSNPGVSKAGVSQGTEPRRQQRAQHAEDQGPQRGQEEVLHEDGEARAHQHRVVTQQPWRWVKLEVQALPVIEVT